MKNFQDLINKVKSSISFNEATKNSKQSIINKVEQSYTKLKTENENSKKVENFEVCYNFLQTVFLFDIVNVCEYLDVINDIMQYIGN